MRCEGWRGELGEIEWCNLVADHQVSKVRMDGSTWAMNVCHAHALRWAEKGWWVNCTHKDLEVAS